MKRKLFLNLFFVFVLSIIPVWAENDEVFRHPLSQNNMNTFNEICAKFAETPVVKGSFEQEKFLSRFNRSLISSGNFIIANEQGMVWETKKPLISTMVLANDFILQSRADGQMSVINAQGNETFKQMAGVLSAVFSGQSRGLPENFKVFFIGNVSEWKIGLEPKDKMIASFAKNITMSGGLAPNGKAAIKSIRILEGSGDAITYTLSNHNYPAELSADEKAFFSIP